ncbi:MAG: isochorismatase family protein [Pirellulales bacterium]|nr:isochorismatase family protein [Pirellulales bacterium]
MPRSSLLPLLLSAILSAAAFSRPSAVADDARESGAFTLHTRSRPEMNKGTFHFPLVYQTVQWDPRKTAVVICDMWDQHWCKSATARVAEMAPRMNALISVAREQGALIVHCPSGTLDFYKDTPGRKLARQAPAVEPRVPLQGWCSLDVQREGQRLPIDDSDGGCPCQPPCPGGHPWTRQIATIEIKPGDAITDNAEAYYLMQQRGIENVIVMGVHTNMCVLGRPFSIRQMVYQGKNVVLVRDLTDSMYNPRREPFVSHFRGTEMVVEHIEKYWCPTITSSDFLGGPAFRFREDTRAHVVLLANEDEYGARQTLPDFAQLLRDCFGYRCTVIQGYAPHDLSGIEALESADVAVLFVRRRALPQQQMAVLRKYLEAGKPLVALRTACHAFDVRGDAPAGSQQWPAFDREVLGCNYRGHGPNQLGTDVALVPEMADHPILSGVKPAQWHSPGSIYLVRPVDEEAEVLAVGTALNLTEPIAWARRYRGGRVFYTSLGHRSDFMQPQFRVLLINAVHWAMGRPVPPLPGDASPDFSAGWHTLAVPGTWDARSGGYLIGYDGYAWYRCLVTVPEAWRDNDLTLSVPEVDNCHEVFFNGLKVGSAGSMPPDYVNGLGSEKPCTVPASRVRSGQKNLVALRVYDHDGRGGFKGKAPSLGFGQQVISLEGKWQFRTGDDARWAQPDEETPPAEAFSY